MRILASGDHHFDQHSHRWSECLRIHEWMLDEAKRQGAGLFVSAGDIYERASTPIERHEVRQWVTAMANICPVIIVRGNHDALLDLRILGGLRAAHPIHVVEDAQVIRIGDTLVGALAWPSTSLIAAQAEALGVPADALAENAMAAVCRGIGAQFDALEGSEPLYRLLVAHAMVDGSVTSLGQPLIGAEMRIGLDTLALSRANTVVLGHIHKAQEWTTHVDDQEVRVLYTGSPFRTAFGETEEKSILSIDTEAGITRIPTPATPMLLLEGVARMGKPSEGAEHAMELALDGRSTAALERIKGAEVRLRYTVAASQAGDAKRAASKARDEMLADGALSVKVEAVVDAVTRARAPEVTKAGTIAEKLEVLWKLRGNAPSDGAKDRIIAKLGSLSQ